MRRSTNQLQELKRSCNFLHCATILKLPVVRYLGLEHRIFKTESLRANHPKYQTTTTIKGSLSA